MSRKEFEKELEPLQTELVKLQEWTKATGAKVCVLFEGRDAAGKGGIIKCITERTSPRVFSCGRAAIADRAGEVADVLPALHSPSAGRWRGCALRPQLVQPGGRRAGDGLHPRRTGADLPEDTSRGSNERSSRPASSWSSTGWKRPWKTRPNASRNASTTIARSGSSAPWIWKAIGAGTTTRGRDAMFAATDTPESPWYVVDSHDQKRGRLNCISHLLSLIPYHEIPHEEVKLPKRQPKGDYVEPDYPFRRIPEKY